jgi:hypothetical protein
MDLRHALAAVFADAVPAGVSVSAYPAGADVAADGVWIVGVTGELSRRVMSPTAPYDDLLEVSVVCRAATRGREAAGAMEQITRIVDAVVGAVDDGGATLVVPDAAGLLVMASRLSGPDIAGGVDGDGWAGFADLTLTVELQADC